MSWSDALFAGHYKEAVRFRELGEVGQFTRGNGLQKSDLVEHGAPAIHYGQIHTHYGVWTTKTKSSVTPTHAAKLRRAVPGDLIIATTSEDDGAVAKATAWLGDGEVAIGGDTYIYRHSLDPRYVAYYFQSDDFQRQKRRHITGAKVRRISGDSLAKMRIPVPPVDVQQEIVNVLDKFTELEAELEARRRQYEHYRDSLLTFPQAAGVKWVPMGELGEFIRGRRFTKADYAEDGIPAIHYGEIYTRFGVAASSVSTHLRHDIQTNLRYAKTGDVVIVDVGETVEDVGRAVAWLGPHDVAIHDHSFAFRHSQDPSYISYYLRTKSFQQEKAKYVARTKVKTLLMTGLAKVKVPVPPLVEQEHIVATLDKFDALVNDLSIGLPAELAARRRQYEHYRDRLLTFKEAA